MTEEQGQSAVDDDQSVAALVGDDTSDTAHAVDARIGEATDDLRTTIEAGRLSETSQSAAIARRTSSVFLSEYDFKSSNSAAANADALNHAFADAGPGGNVVLPAVRENFNIACNTVVIAQPGQSLTSPFPRDEYYPRLTGVGAGSIVTIGPGDSPTQAGAAYSFRVENVNFVGDGGAATASPGLSYPTAGSAGLVENALFFNYGNGIGDIDSEVINCGFSKMKAGIRAIGRNLIIRDCLFSHTVNGINIELATNAGEIRGHRIFNNRFHTLRNGYETPPAGYRGVCIDIAPEGFKNTIQNNYADAGCRRFYYGPSHASVFTGNVLSLMHGTAFEFNDGTRPYNAGALVSGNSYSGNYYSTFATVQHSQLTVTPDHFVLATPGAVLGRITIVGNSIARTRYSAIKIATNAAPSIVGNNIHDAGMYQSFDGVSSSGVELGAGVGSALVTGNAITTTMTPATHAYGVDTSGSSSAQVIANIVAAGRVSDYNIAPSTVLIQGDGLPVAQRLAAGAQTWGIAFDKNTSTPARLTFGRVDVESLSDTVGGEKSNVHLKGIANGTLISLVKATWDGLVTLSGALVLTPRAQSPAGGTVIPNNALFVDSADNVLKFKNSAGAVKTVTMG